MTEGLFGFLILSVVFCQIVKVGIWLKKTKNLGDKKESAGVSRVTSGPDSTKPEREGCGEPLHTAAVPVLHCDWTLWAGGTQPFWTCDPC